MQHKFILVGTSNGGVNLIYEDDNGRVFPVRYFSLFEAEEAFFDERVAEVAEEYVRYHVR